MMELTDLYINKYKLYHLRIKNDDINFRNKIFKYLISYYIAIRKVIKDNTKELAKLFNKEKYYIEEYEKKNKDKIKINNNKNKDKNKDKNNKEDNVNTKINKNLSKGLDLIMKEITKYPRGSIEREKYISYFKKVEQEQIQNLAHKETFKKI